MLRQLPLQHIGQEIAGDLVDALGAGDDDRILAKIRPVVPGGVGLRLRGHGEKDNAGIGNSIRCSRELQRIRQCDPGQYRIMHAIGGKIGHQPRLAADEDHITAAGERNDGGERGAESTGANDCDPFVAAHAFAPRLP